ncbi:MAG: hypothetical protein CO031_01480 [Candidatus Nealsonbacteria bacterium CG_4_9_14_0_2_um_filter_37_38]|uniref:Uncharacterized protein n=1 Tax=Candidatus Nealsonbacteria bacterium CG_4_10_14_0_8_um_filter_37_14 TaxID=1974684 RepID=A0A2M7R6X0_9BACT|nr:MAG: hypothetical protein COV63_00955 [Candidatus Nealsonbacteria bacterium CG11_big_fil_rev_8_21_14_0_20_37_68]PIY89167.1 MAG: hypothetical protein COY73_01755 [Candidatus Nealsonbacteria bacterium CG_4_10_14_0_8_um_filter_37_14]PJC51702.1 MAG: hypothetical protein CO031_01480 [Candidatus Nealsonbacteria bacterium CG_4_9_14_0_2_um_filter_37_38]
MTIKNFEKRIFLGIAGEKEKDWQDKLNDLNKLKTREAALFLERFDQSQRKKIYRALLNMSIKKIPLCHISNDMEVEELVFLESKFKTEYFTIHESGFGFLDKWKGFYKKLYLEMNTDNYVSPKVEVEKIGGFCVDLAHFKIALTNWTQDFDYIYLRKFRAQYACNHLNGYDNKNNSDLHTVKSLKNFDYLKTLPKFIFGKIIALEVENNISQQIKFKRHLVKLLNNLFSEKN